MATEEERATLELVIDARKAKEGAAVFAQSAKQTEKAAADAASAENKLAKETDKAATAHEHVAEEMNRADRILEKITHRLLHYFGAYHLIHLVREAIATVAEFEESVVTLAAATDGSVKSIQSLTEAAIELTAGTKFNASEATGALTALAKSGFSVADSIAILPSAIHLAEAGFIGLGTAADITAKTLHQFGLTTKDTERIVDDLIIVTNKSSADVGGLSESMRMVGPIASAFGISIESVAAALGVLSNAGTQGTLAGSSLRTILTNLVRPSQQTRDVIQSLGLSMKDLDPATHSLSEIMGRFKDANIDAESASKAFSSRLASMILVLTGNVDKLKELEVAQKRNVGEAERLSEAIGSTLLGRWREFKNSTDDLALSLGNEGALGALKGFLILLTDTFTALAGGKAKAEGFATGAQTLAKAIKFLAEMTLVWLGLKMAEVFFSITRRISDMISAVLNATTAMEQLVAVSGLAKGVLLGGLTLVVAGLIEWWQEIQNVKKATDDLILSVHELDKAQRLLRGAASAEERFERTLEVVHKNADVVRADLAKISAIMTDLLGVPDLPKLDFGTKDEIEKLKDLIRTQRSIRPSEREGAFTMGSFFGIATPTHAKEIASSIEVLNMSLGDFIANQNRLQGAIAETFTVLSDEVSLADKRVSDSFARNEQAPQAFVDAQLRALEHLRSFVDKIIGSDELAGLGKAAGITDKTLAELAARIEALRGVARDSGKKVRDLGGDMGDAGEGADALGAKTETASEQAKKFVEELTRQNEALRNSNPETRTAVSMMDALTVATKLGGAEASNFLRQAFPLIALHQQLQDNLAETTKRTQGMARFTEMLAKTQEDQKFALMGAKEAERARAILEAEKALATSDPDIRKQRIADYTAELDKLDQLNTQREESIKLREKEFETLRLWGEAAAAALADYDGLVATSKEDIEVLQLTASLRTFSLRTLEDESRAREKLLTIRKAEQDLRSAGVEGADLNILLDALSRKIDLEQHLSAKEELLGSIARGAQQSFESFFDAIVFGSAKASDALRELAMQLLKMVVNQMFFQPAASALGGAFSSLFGIIPTGAVPHAAEGAILSGPTFIPSHGVLAGEAGAEGIFPLSRTSTGDLGVKVAGGGGNLTLNLIVNGVSNVDEFRRSRKQIMMGIDRSARKARETLDGRV